MKNKINNSIFAFLFVVILLPSKNLIMSQILIYESADGQTQLEVQLENQTVWLSQAQMSLLFDRDQSVISRHIRNVFTEGELDENSNMQILHIANVDKPTTFYNLDVIISVGYRVKSKKGTQFRQWATQCIKDLLIKGYVANEKRLAELSQVVSIISNLQKEDLSLSEKEGLLNILSNYTQSYILLNQFDSNSLKTNNLDENISYEISYADAIGEIKILKQKLIDLNEANQLFGNEKDDSFNGILGNILQTFDGQYLYPSIEEQAANLLYFIIKNHPFTDGNKRIGAFIFIWFLEKNQHRFDKLDRLKINPNGLVTLALLIAQSNPSDKNLMINLVINLIKN